MRGATGGKLFTFAAAKKARHRPGCETRFHQPRLRAKSGEIAAQKTPAARKERTTRGEGAAEKQREKVLTITKKETSSKYPHEK